MIDAIIFTPRAIDEQVYALMILSSAIKTWKLKRERAQPTTYAVPNSLMAWKVARAWNIILSFPNA